MDYKKLIEKYWNGGTSIAEEQSLKAYFNREEISGDLMEYAKPHFSNARIWGGLLLGSIMR